MLTLYGDLDSGNVYKVRLLLAQLGIPYRRIDTTQNRGETRTAAFRAINPIGKIPTLVFDDGRMLSESGAILYYFARDTVLFPIDAWDQANVLRWMFFEQYSHEPYIAVARFWLTYAAPEELAKKRHLAPEWHEKGYAALRVMETHLKTHDWFAGGRYSIADIALYGYTHSANEGGFDLTDYPAVRRWLDRVASQPGYISLQERP